MGQNHYERMTSFEVENFQEMFGTFQDLILSMIRNAVRALPNDKNNTRPDIKSYMHVKALSDSVKYDKVIDIKDVFLSCIPSEEKRNIFNESVKTFIVDKNQKIRFYIRKSAYERLDLASKTNFSADIKKLEEIINNINNNFNKLLPEAKKQGMLMISKIKSIDIPDKAKYQGRKQEKGKGREM